MRDEMVRLTCESSEIALPGRLLALMSLLGSVFSYVRVEGDGSYRKAPIPSGLDLAGRGDLGFHIYAMDLMPSVKFFTYFGVFVQGEGVSGLPNDTTSSSIRGHANLRLRR